MGGLVGMLPLPGAWHRQIAGIHVVDGGLSVEIISRGAVEQVAEGNCVKCLTAGFQTVPRQRVTT